MTIKMTQSPENKMELQINRLESRIEKMQEMDLEEGLRRFKDLEEIKKSHSIMKNEITEIKNTLEGANSGITEAKERISEVEDRIVETNETGRKKIKRN